MAMKHLPLSMSLLLAVLMGCQVSGTGRGPASEFHWLEKDQNLTLMKGEQVVWNLVYNSAEKKTFFHPLYSLNGVLMTSDGPADHPWHHGLWFSWKFINGENFWEEDKRLQGVSELQKVKISKNDDFSARVELSISYHLPGKKELVAERRTLKVSRPDLQNNSYTIDWSAEFSASQDVVFSGTYAGLSVRLSKNPEMSYISSGKHTSDGTHSRIHGKEAEWLEASITRGQQRASIRFHQSTGNMRHPAPWFFRHQYPYMSPALLTKRITDSSGKRQKPQAIELKQGESFTLNYSIRVFEPKG